MKSFIEGKMGDVLKKKPPVAGGSSITPVEPVYRTASNYKPVERVNAAPGGGKKSSGKPITSLGQGSYDQGQKDKLVDQFLNQRDPYRVTGDDFSVKSASEFHGQGGEHGTAVGKNDLAILSDHQEGARCVEDDGYGPHGSGTPVPGNRGARVAAAFPIGVSKGESNEDTGEVKISESVNLQTGYLEDGAQTRVMEVPEDKLSIGTYKNPGRWAGLEARD